MIVIYNRRRRAWKSCKMLVDAIRHLEVPVRSTATIPPHDPATIIVSWGYSCESAALNKKIIGNKLLEMHKLREANVPVPNFDEKLPVPNNWLKRRKHHRAGNDLLRQTENIQFDFYVEKIDTVHEFRVHIFKNKSIRIGLKIKKNDAAHPWIKSLRRGWKISYGLDCQAALVKGVRRVAKRAVRALGYDFGAVDVGLRPDGTPVVFEVNSAPGLDNEHTADAYAKHIVRCLTGQGE